MWEYLSPERLSQGDFVGTNPDGSKWYQIGFHRVNKSQWDAYQTQLASEASAASSLATLAASILADINDPNKVFHTYATMPFPGKGDIQPLALKTPRELYPASIPDADVANDLARLVTLKILNQVTLT